MNDYTNLEKKRTKLERKWFVKFNNINFHLNINKPSGLFTKYDDRKSRVDADVKYYIDTQL